jgi:hypothetical protein
MKYTRYHTYTTTEKDKFYLVYANMIAVSVGLDKTESAVLSYFMEYSTNVEFDITKNIRKSIAKKFEISERMVFNIIPVLVEKKTLIETENNLYKINPDYSSVNFRHDKGDEDDYEDGLTGDILFLLKYNPKRSNS